MAEECLPALVAHADWSCSPGKRWMARTLLSNGGTYHALAPEPVGDPGTLLSRLRADAPRHAAILLGFDFPIGLPAAYADRAGITDFLALLPQLGTGAWPDFYRVAERQEEISLRRPFYPCRPGGAKQSHLADGLSVASFSALRRRCEEAQPGRNPACPIFWTLGGNQVGRAAIGGWREVLAPPLSSGDAGVSIWPFSGALNDLLRPGQTVIAETYPAEFYTHLGVERAGRGWSKRKRDDRARQAGALLRWAAEAGHEVTPALRSALLDGFRGTGGDDRFDAVVGLFGMLNVVLERRDPGVPDDERVKRVEGWILGQQPI